MISCAFLGEGEALVRERSRQSTGNHDEDHGLHPDSQLGSVITIRSPLCFPFPSVTSYSLDRVSVWFQICFLFFCSQQPMSRAVLGSRWDLASSQKKDASGKAEGRRKDLLKGHILAAAHMTQQPHFVVSLCATPSRASCLRSQLLTARVRP